MVNYINQAPHYHPEKYIWINRFPPNPGQAAINWIQLLFDIAKDPSEIAEGDFIPSKQQVRKETKLHIINQLTQLKNHFATLKNEDLADKLGLSVEQIAALKAQRIDEALRMRNTLLQTLQPSETNNGSE